MQEGAGIQCIQFLSLQGAFCTPLAVNLCLGVTVSARSQDSIWRAWMVGRQSANKSGTERECLIARRLWLFRYLCLHPAQCCGLDFCCQAALSLFTALSKTVKKMIWLVVYSYEISSPTTIFTFSPTDLKWVMISKGRFQRSLADRPVTIGEEFRVLIDPDQVFTGRQMAFYCVQVLYKY